MPLAARRGQPVDAFLDAWIGTAFAQRGEFGRINEAGDCLDGRIDLTTVRHQGPEQEWNNPRSANHGLRSFLRRFCPATRAASSPCPPWLPHPHAQGLAP